MNVLNNIIDEDKKDYKCFQLLKELLEKDEQFRSIIEKGIAEGKIYKFTEELWDKIKNQNIRRINSFLDVFKVGANIGYCTVASRQLSYSLNDCYICGGTLPILINTPNCKDGSHTWISYDGKIIDTSLMLIIDEGYKNALGYHEENRYNPNVDKNYRAAKEWTNDKNINGKGR